MNNKEKNSLKNNINDYKNSFKKNWNIFKNDAKECISEFKNKETRKNQIPNLLTASRLLSPIFIIPSAISGNIPLALGFTALFASTDALDGYFARKYKCTSEFGRELDPLTDKLFAISLLTPLLMTNPVLIANLIMEFIIGGINLNSRLKDNKPRTSIIGKVKTGALSLTIIAGYLSMFTMIPANLFNNLIVTTFILQNIAAFKYYKKYQQTEEEKNIHIKENEYIEEKDELEKNNEKVKELNLEKINNSNDKTVEINKQKQFLINYKDELLNTDKKIDKQKQKKIGIK